ncbi:exodeoxyribonuclease VII small subunit [Helicobacter monodelphidis]|uniref:exodeoxyribonuclease VII small subunit n=1 Tax=Helicobacter sp. 15-1451 TaxID=2004995 RepID=UPI000DCDC694|nr:exodeoxyribonuclease VII small subunit [Helicobacter sp. 15-1451]RAX58817.1 exodeoxyribonuclease VII small subunit [Helicobacter sp. 15-1451]
MKKQESFEEKVLCIENILKHLSKEDISLEESLRVYKEGAQKIKEAQEILHQAEIAFEEINMDRM